MSFIFGADMKSAPTNIYLSAALICGGYFYIRLCAYWAHIFPKALEIELIL